MHDKGALVYTIDMWKYLRMDMQKCIPQKLFPYSRLWSIYVLIQVKYIFYKTNDKHL